MSKIHQVDLSLMHN